MTMINGFTAEDAARLSETERALIERRARVLGPAYRLFYEHPLHLVKGEGVWLYDADGKRYLDAYNNVASIGHCTPRWSRRCTQRARARSLRWGRSRRSRAW